MSAPTAEAKLDEIKARWSIVAEEPWKCTAGGAILDAQGRRIALLDREGSAVEHPYLRAETAKAIAAAPDDVAWLAAEVKRLRAACETAEAEAAGYRAALEFVSGQYTADGVAVEERAVLEGRQCSTTQLGACVKMAREALKAGAK